MALSGEPRCGLGGGRTWVGALGEAGDRQPVTKQQLLLLMAAVETGWLPAGGGGARRWDGCVLLRVHGTRLCLV